MFIYWRASEASETVLGVDNAKSGICYIYVCMYGINTCITLEIELFTFCMLFKRARGELFSPKNTAI